MRTEDDYFNLVGALDERLSAQGPDDHIRQIARQEADNRIMVFIGIGLICWATFWATEKYGWIGIASVVGLGILVAKFSAWRDGFDPKHEQHLVIINAENLVRLQSIAKDVAAGESIWALKDKDYETDKRQIVVADDYQWEGFWERTYKTALDLEALSPRVRQKRILKAAKAASTSLIHARDLAKREKAELVYWAASALDLLERS